MARDVYTADMGNPPVEEDAGILSGRKRGVSPVATPARRGAASVAVRPNPADANIFTADKGIQPPSPDEGPTMTRRRATGMKAGGKVGSASKRADGCAIKGKTKGKIV